MKSRGNMWTKIQSAFKVYVIELSDLGGIWDVECPECHKPLPNRLWEGVPPVWGAGVNNEGEVTSWTHVCECGTTMKVFND